MAISLILTACGPNELSVDAGDTTSNTATDTIAAAEDTSRSDARPSHMDTETTPTHDAGDTAGGSRRDTTNRADTAPFEDTRGGDTAGRNEFEPAVYRTHNKADVCSEPKVSKCTASDLDWVDRVYGLEVKRPPKSWTSGSSHTYRLVGLVERVGPSNVDVYVYDENGSPLQNVEVAWWWNGVAGSGSAVVPASSVEWKSHFIPAKTGAKGRAGFGLYGSAYIDNCGAGGPHAIWISDGSGSRVVASDLVSKIGMLGGTNHRHLNLVYQRTKTGATPSTNAVQCPLP